jgi:phosphoglycolate phosphatase-like HAD superfamily hydrolase
LLAKALQAKLGREMRPTVLLFDIDGTLITTGGVGRRAIQRAFAARYGSTESLSFSFGGMTDRAIIRDALAVTSPDLQGAELQTEIERVIEQYLEVLEEEARQSDALRVHAGVQAALDASLARVGCAVGLGTGNVKRGAGIKLSRVGLYGSFRFGGFGCDHIDRAELLRIGAQRGADQLAAPLAECRVVVIGDTPKDVRAAQAIGAESIAVATGASTLEELRAAKPTFLFADLTASGATSALLAE